MPDALAGSAARPGSAAGLVVLLLGLAVASGAGAAWSPDGIDLTRPRLMLRGADFEELRSRLERDPYRLLFLRMDQRIREAEGFALDDHSIDAHRKKSSAAKNLAFRYALDRTVIGGQIVPFPTPADRQAAGDRARELLVNLFPRSRVAVPPPLGDWDRDISTSEELLQYAVTYDMLLGAGYDLGADRAVIAGKLTDVASELYLNYIDPSTAISFPLALWVGTEVHQNNHRAKTGSALIAAGVALAEETPARGDDPLGIRDPADWVEYGLDELDLITRWVLTAGDGAYGEGPHYLNFSALNLHPLLRMWDRLVGGATVAARGLDFPSLWRHPLYQRSQRWALDVTMPDGSLAPIDDSPVGEAFFFGTAPRPADPAVAAAFAWRWANATEPYATLGNMDLSAEAILNHLDDVAPAPPPGSPTAFYVEGGTATLRSDWSEDAVAAVVLGEHDTASEFGRDRDGFGRSPQSHEHEEPGAFMLHAFGERLLMDPGIVRFDVFNDLARPPAHNVILVQGTGPIWTLTATVNWAFDPLGRPPADGQTTLHDSLDSDFLDAVSVVSEYGRFPTRIRRRFLFPDHRYLVVADRVRGSEPDVEYTWLLHGNGGEDSGGAFELTETGGRWSRPKARLDAALDLLESEPVLSAAVSEHEEARGQRRRHAVLRGRATGETLHAVQLLYPSPSESAVPTLRRLALAGAAAAALDDPDGDRRVAVAYAGPGGGPLVLPGTESGLFDAETDGSLLLVDTHSDRSLRVAWAEAATHLVYGGDTALSVVTPGGLGWRPSPDRVDVVVDNADALVELSGLPFDPAAVDGGCALHRRGERIFVELGRERRFAVRASGENARPAADPGADRRSAVGELVPLDARASCDADGDALSARWQLVSAPRGSEWSLTGDESFEATLLTDVPGPYRVRLVVTDARGLASQTAERVVVAGDRCADGVDDDLDGLIDSDDPDCDSPPDANRPPDASVDAYVVPADEGFESTTSVLANDGDPDGDVLTPVLVERPAHGELLLLADGGFFYDPTPGFAGADRFRYAARDADGAESAPAEVALEVVARDQVELSLRFLGRHPALFSAGGALVEGDVAIERAGRGGITRAHGSGAIAAEGAPAEFEFDFRPREGSNFEGHFAVRHPSLPSGAVERHDARAHILPDGDGAIRGWLLEPGRRPGYSFTWRVIDAAR